MGANYRAACRGRSKAEFNSKLHIVLEEAELLPKKMVYPLLIEANELTAIFSRSYSTAKKNK